MLQKTIFLLFIFHINVGYSCDCKNVSLKEAYESSTDVVLGKVTTVEKKTYVVPKVGKDSIQNHYERLLPNDTIHYVEYTLQITKNYKSQQKSKELTVRVGARNSNCDLKFKLGGTYMLYGQNNRWEKLFYPNDKYFVLTSICTRTTLNWRKEQKILESYLRSETLHSRKIEEKLQKGDTLVVSVKPIGDAYTDLNHTFKIEFFTVADTYFLRYIKKDTTHVKELNDQKAKVVIDKFELWKADRCSVSQCGLTYSEVILEIGRWKRSFRSDFNYCSGLIREIFNL